MAFEDMDPTTKQRVIALVAFVVVVVVIVVYMYIRSKSCKAGNFYDSKTFTCLPCEAGSFSADSAAECTKCSAGTISKAGAAACTKCEAGTYSSTAGAIACTKCAAGTYSSATGAASATTCTKCAAGTYSSATGATSDATCTACGAGTYSSATGATSDATCTACGAGTYSSATGAGSDDTCTKCGAGTYSTAEGATSATTCTACGAGTYSTATGAGSATTCTKCGAGTYSSATGAGSATTCTACGAGTYSSATGATSATTCTKCGAGTYSSATGAGSATTCTTCGAGTYSQSGASVCYKVSTTAPIVARFYSGDIVLPTLNEDGTAPATPASLAYEMFEKIPSKPDSSTQGGAVTFYGQNSAILTNAQAPVLERVALAMRKAYTFNMWVKINSYLNFTGGRPLFQFGSGASREAIGLRFQKFGPDAATPATVTLVGALTSGSNELKLEAASPPSVRVCWIHHAAIPDGTNVTTAGNAGTFSATVASSTTLTFTPASGAPVPVNGMKLRSDSFPAGTAVNSIKEVATNSTTGVVTLTLNAALPAAMTTDSSYTFWTPTIMSANATSTVASANITQVRSFMVVAEWFNAELFGLVPESFATPDSLEATKDSYHMVTTSFKDNTRTIYFDGVKIIEQDNLFEYALFTGAALSIGSAFDSFVSDTADTRTTTVADFRAWTSKLTDSEVTKLFEEGVLFGPAAGSALATVARATTAQLSAQWTTDDVPTDSIVMRARLNDAAFSIDVRKADNNGLVTGFNNYHLRAATSIQPTLTDGAVTMTTNASGAAALKISSLQALELSQIAKSMSGAYTVNVWMKCGAYSTDTLENMWRQLFGFGFKVYDRGLGLGMIPNRLGASGLLRLHNMWFNHDLSIVTPMAMEYLQTNLTQFHMYTVSWSPRSGERRIYFDGALVGFDQPMRNGPQIYAQVVDDNGSFRRTDKEYPRVGDKITTYWTNGPNPVTLTVATVSATDPNLFTVSEPASSLPPILKKPYNASSNNVTINFGLLPNFSGNVFEGVSVTVSGSTGTFTTQGGRPSVNAEIAINTDASISVSFNSTSNEFTMISGTAPGVGAVLSGEIDNDTRRFKFFTVKTVTAATTSAAAKFTVFDPPEFATGAAAPASSSLNYVLVTTVATHVDGAGNENKFTVNNYTGGATAPGSLKQIIEATTLMIGSYLNNGSGIASAAGAVQNTYKQFIAWNSQLSDRQVRKLFVTPDFM